MKLSVRAAVEPFARALQNAYARAIRSSGPRVSHEETRGPPGGSLGQAVRQPGLVRFERWGFVFSPSKLGLHFGLWWKGTRRQRARGRAIPINTAKLARELEDDLVQQVQAADRSVR